MSRLNLPNPLPLPPLFLHARFPLRVKLFLLTCVPFIPGGPHRLPSSLQLVWKEVALPLPSSHQLQCPKPSEKLANPKKDWMCLTVVGAGQSATAETLEESILMP